MADLLDRGLNTGLDEGDFLDEIDGPSDTGLGTSTLISAINSLPNRSRDRVFDCIMINVATLIRNVLSKEKTDDEIITQVKLDINDLVTAVVNYHEVMGSVVHEPKLIVYLPDYTGIPSIHARSMTGNRKRIFDIVNKLITNDNLRVRKRITGYEKQTLVVEMFAGGKEKLPYMSVLYVISEFHKLGLADPRTSLANYLLISHMHLDYHFMLKQRRTTILESFSGNFIKPKALGYKVFGTNFIPFNSVTHLLFGDKTYIKPMALRKNKQLLTDMAKRQSWYVRTPSEIARYVEVSGQVPAKILTHLKL